MQSNRSQPGILAPVPALGRSLTFSLIPGADPRGALRRLQDGFAPESGVVALGEQVARALGHSVEGLRTFPGLSGPLSTIPSTQRALWVFLAGADRTTLFDLTERTRGWLEGSFAIEDAMDTFKYADGDDLTGYEDGTENPVGDAAVEAALVGPGSSLEGSSFVAVQRWVHDLDRFRGFPLDRRDATIGRRQEDNEEIEDAPPSAHVKRTAQESFDPPAFMVRRSMPWATGLRRGLEFIAYANTLDRFERVLRRMAGLEDGIADALFTFSRPVTGGYYWCPPVAEGRLDLRLLGL